jgi:hypothetical protein
MTINDLISMLMDVPPMLAGAWAAWFFVGLLLSIWTRREEAPQHEVVQLSPRHKSGARAAAATRPFDSVRVPKPVQHVPLAGGDAFADLERLLEPEHTLHIPGERQSPVLSEAPMLAAPQSLP